jgi:hypothetical protein
LGALEPSGDFKGVRDMKFKSKPVIKEAFRWMHDEVPDWWKSAEGIQIKVETGSAFIPTLEGVHEAKPGDWIIQGLKGELYPCKHEIFLASYEPA